jgi:hypothetical protein
MADLADIRWLERAWNRQLGQRLDRCSLSGRESHELAVVMTLPHTLGKARTATALTTIVVVAGGWMALVGSHDPGGPYGESTAAWAQAIMSVGAILAAVVIDQGASRRDRLHRLEAAAAARAARIRLLQLCAKVLDNAAEAARKRPLKRGQRFEGLAVEAVRSAQQVVRHFAERGSDSDPLLVWVLKVAVTEMDAAAGVMDGHRLATSADLAALERAIRSRAQALRELVDEYQAGLHEV